MTTSASSALKGLYREFGDKVGFVELYVREAHPGERYPQSGSFEEKLEHTRAFKQSQDIPWPVAVDDIDGSLHRALGPNPHAAYVMDVRGNVAFRALWANDDAPLRQALREVAEGRPVARQNTGKLVPMLKGMGMMDEVWETAGTGAKQDVLREVPPLYGMARLARLFQPLPPLGRGIAAMSASMLALVLAAVGVRRLATR